MRKTTLASALIGLSLPMSAIASAPTVAVDIAPLHSLVSQVMEGVGEPELLIPAEASPHSYVLRPSQAKALENAKAIFWIGSELSPWLEKAMKNVADDATKVEMLEVAGTTTYEFREGATFEEHAHDDEEGDHEEHHDDHSAEHHDEHADEHHEGGFFDGILSFFGLGHDHHDEHDEHDEHHDDHHGEGQHGFEWAGAFDLAPGEYTWTFAKVDGKYADPAMKMVFMSSNADGEDAIESLEEAAEKLLESEGSSERTHGGTLTSNESSAYKLAFDQSREVTEYRVSIEKQGVYTFFTEHMPFEFEADEHFLKDSNRADIEPIAQVPAEGHDHHHHGGVDPHAWLDPANAKVWVENIESVLSKLDPENADSYAKNAGKAKAELDALINETQTNVSGLGELKFIVFHDAYQYFEKRFGIAATGSISLGDAEDPSPKRIAEIRDTVKNLGVNCVFTEPQYNPGLVENVFQGSVVKAIGVMDPLGASIEEGPGHYSNLIQGMVASLGQCNK